MEYTVITTNYRHKIFVKKVNVIFWKARDYSTLHSYSTVGAQCEELLEAIACHNAESTNNTTPLNRNNFPGAKIK